MFKNILRIAVQEALKEIVETCQPILSSGKKNYSKKNSTSLSLLQNCPLALYVSQGSLQRPLHCSPVKGRVAGSTSLKHGHSYLGSVSKFIFSFLLLEP